MFDLEHNAAAVIVGVSIFALAFAWIGANMAEQYHRRKRWGAFWGLLILAIIIAVLAWGEAHPYWTR